MAFADDYVPVNERIEAFYEHHPDGSIQCEIHTLTDTLVVMRASVYRSPDDLRPSVAHSMLAIPGKTNFTRGSEVENAETSAVGRAIAMFGYEVKRGIATREDVRNKAGEHGAEVTNPKPDTTQAPKRDLEAESYAVVFQAFVRECKAGGVGARLICEALGFEAESAEMAKHFMETEGPDALRAWEEANEKGWNHLSARLIERRRSEVEAAAR